MGKRQSRKALVLFKGVLAGQLEETDTGYVFCYDAAFIAGNIPLSVSLPLRDKAYESPELFSFFTGLLPEGWYLDIVSSTQKIDKNDQFAILLATCQDTAGAVSVQKIP